MHMPNGFRLDFNENLFEYVIVGGVVVAIVAAAIGCRSAVVWKRYYMHMLNKIRLLLTFHINTHIHDSFSFIATQIMQSTTTQVGVREKEYVGGGGSAERTFIACPFLIVFSTSFFSFFPLTAMCMCIRNTLWLKCECFVDESVPLVFVYERNDVAMVYMHETEKHMHDRTFI